MRGDREEPALPAPLREPVRDPGRSEPGRSELGRSELGRSELGRSEVGRCADERPVGRPAVDLWVAARCAASRSARARASVPWPASGRAESWWVAWRAESAIAAAWPAGPACLLCRRRDLRFDRSPVRWASPLFWGGDACWGPRWPPLRLPCCSPVAAPAGAVPRLPLRVSAAAGSLRATPPGRRGSCCSARPRPGRDAWAGVLGAACWPPRLRRERRRRPPRSAPCGREASRPSAAGRRRFPLPLLPFRSLLPALLLPALLLPALLLPGLLLLEPPSAPLLPLAGLLLAGLIWVGLFWAEIAELELALPPAGRRPFRWPRRSAERRWSRPFPAPLSRESPAPAGPRCPSPLPAPAAPARGPAAPVRERGRRRLRRPRSPWPRDSFITTTVVGGPAGSYLATRSPTRVCPCPQVDSPG